MGTAPYCCPVLSGAGGAHTQGLRGGQPIKCIIIKIFVIYSGKSGLLGRNVCGRKPQTSCFAVLSLYFQGDGHGQEAHRNRRALPSPPGDRATARRNCGGLGPVIRRYAHHSLWRGGGKIGFAGNSDRHRRSNARPIRSRRAPGGWQTSAAHCGYARPAYRQRHGRPCHRPPYTAPLSWPDAARPRSNRGQDW